MDNSLKLYWLLKQGRRSKLIHSPGDYRVFNTHQSFYFFLGSSDYNMNKKYLNHDFKFFIKTGI